MFSEIRKEWEDNSTLRVPVAGKNAASLELLRSKSPYPALAPLSLRFRLHRAGLEAKEFADQPFLPPSSILLPSPIYPPPTIHMHS